MRLEVFLLSAFLLGPGSVAWAGNLTLASRDSDGTAVIVLPTAPTSNLRTASEELVRWIGRLTGVEPGVIFDDRPLPASAILLGRTRYSEALLGTKPGEGFSTGSFRLKACGRRLVVDGDDAGVLYGVYELLNRFGGIEWFTDKVVTVPGTGRLEVPEDLDLRVTPSIPVRDPGHGMFADGLTAARLRVNGFHQQGGKDGFGGCPFRWNAKFRHCHSMHFIASKQEFGATHPEYFEKDEQGRPKRDWPRHPQLCLTEPGVLALTKERLGAELEGDRESKYFGISQEDYETWCRCPKCRALTDAEGSDSGSLVPYLNEVADFVAEKRPDAFLTTLAYHGTRTPPRTLELRKNVLVGLCLTECDFSRPLLGHPDEGNRGFLRAFEGWSRISGGVWIWDYCTDYEWHAFPMPNVHALAENLRLYAKWGVRYVYEESYWTPYSYFDDLKGYLCAKLMWDASQELEPLVDNFIRACYGPAAKPVRAIFDMYENHPRDLLRERMNYEVKPFSDMFPDALHEEAARLWREAEGLVGDELPYADYVRRGRFGNETVRLVRYLYRLRRDGRATPEGPSYRDEMRNVARRMMSIERCRQKGEGENGRKTLAWSWGWSWGGRRPFGKWIEAFAEGEDCPEGK